LFSEYPFNSQIAPRTSLYPIQHLSSEKKLEIEAITLR